MASCRFTPEEDEIIRKYHPMTRVADYYHLLNNRTIGSVRVRATRIGVKKSPEGKRLLMERANAQKRLNLAGVIDESFADLGEEYLQYLSGLFDTDGSIGFRKLIKDNHKYISAAFIVINKYKPIIEKLHHDIPGGHIFGDTSQVWQWRLTSRDRLIILLERVLPYLIVKHEQVDIVLNCLKNHAHDGEYLWDKVEEVQLLKRQFSLTTGSNITWAYVAGVLDGDGCISYHRTSLRISITTLDHNFAEQLSRFIGCAHIATVSNKGKPSHHLPLYRVIVSGNDRAYDFLKKVQPYLYIKKAQAEYLLTELANYVNWNHYPDRQKRLEIKEHLSMLKRIFAP
jgi:hypothetical protein